MHVCLLTGGGDASYAFGLALSLAARGASIDFIGSDDSDSPLLRSEPSIRLYNLRGDMRDDASLATKALRVCLYYARLVRYAAGARPRIFHILWNNKFQLIDRTILMLYYRALGRKIAFTAHNVNAAQRDGHDNVANRVSLRIQYRLAHHIFVHTNRMKLQLIGEFGVQERKVSVIPFGVNSTVPDTSMSTDEAKGQLGIRPDEHAALFFGQIAPYKGLDYLLDALPRLVGSLPNFRLVIAGRVKQGFDEYWRSIERQLSLPGVAGRVILRNNHIPDDEVEVYFKAADVLILPYVHVFQSGVLFLAYNFGLPVIVTDVGSLKDDVLEDRSGLVCNPRDPLALAEAISRYFASDMFRDLPRTRERIRLLASEKHSWSKVGEITESVYQTLLGVRSS
jgi:glycosyltransferase involved in cell wall biosynthesis